MKRDEFYEVFEKYSDRLYNLAYRMVGSIQDAEDIVQETFYNAYKHIDDFRSESTVYTWIYRICVNECLRTRKKIDLDDYVSIDDTDCLEKYFVDNQIDKPEETAILSELTKLIRTECHSILMQKLPQNQRVVFIMKMIMEMSYSEIAEILEVDENVVRSRLHRARTSLLDHFQNKCHWYMKGGPSPCCEKKIGRLLQQDMEALKRIHSKLDEHGLDISPEENKTIEYIYSHLPMLKHDMSSIKI